MTKDTALRLALEALEFDSFYGTGKQEAITAIKAALEAKDEPVGSFMTRLQAIDFLLKMRPQTEPTEKQIIATIDAYSALFGDMIESPVLPKQEAKDEPVAWRWIPSKIWGSYVLSDDPAKAELAREHAIEVQPLYTTPTQRKPLTDEEIEKCWDSAGYTGIIPKGFARAIEAAHGITGDNK